MLQLGRETGELLDRLGVDRALRTDGSMPSVTPLTGEQLGMVQVADAAAIDEKLDAASAAFRAWRDVPARAAVNWCDCGAKNCARRRTISRSW